MELVDLKKELGTVVRSRRKSLGLSQEALAERAQLHRTYVTDVERGSRNLTLDSIGKLARGLNIPIAALFDRANPLPAFQSPGPSQKPGGSVNILLVEDDERDVELSLEAFRQAKMMNRVEVVRDGAEALDYLFCRRAYQSRRPDELPQVILLDLNLPKVHGIEVLRQIKADARTRAIEVVVLSASRRNEHINEALRLGATAYLLKPVDFQRFSQITPQMDFHWKLLSMNWRPQAPRPGPIPEPPAR